MRRAFLTTLMCLLGLASVAQAVNYTNEVLAIGVGARALGMGGAYVAVADDSTAVYWNPAGLTHVQHMEVAAIQQGRDDTALNFGTNQVGSQYFFMSGAATLPDIGSLGLAVMRFGVGNIDQTTSQGGSGPPNVIGTFSEQDMAVLLGYAHNIGKAFSVGVTAKSLWGGTNGLVSDPADGITGDANYSYFGADLGILAKFGEMSQSLEGLVLGVNLQDAVNTGVNWNTDGGAESVDMNAKAGLAYSLPFDFLKDSRSSITLAVDADPKYSTLMHYGIEYWYKDVLAMRAGVRQFTAGTQTNEPSFGASFRFYMLQVDYAFINYELTPVQYLSLIVRF
jgi:hypothetical protein